GHAFVDGIALWSPRLPGWDAAAPILRGDAPPTDPQPRPAPALLAPTERRRAPDTVAIALEVASAACAAAGADPKSLPSVFACTHGDLAITDYMCRTLAGNATDISPTKFHNSVHNAAVGYWTIGTGCMQPSTALSAFDHTFGQGLLEALSQVAADGTRVLFSAYDIEAVGPMRSVTTSRGLLGGALVLAPAAGERSAARLSWQVVRTNGAIDEPMPAAVTDAVAGNPLASSLPLFRALARGAGRASVTLSPSQSLLLEVAACR
ncbi:MAG TPA: beta-ketoacyl synthase chain length factor, partial [Xanthomonadales bacterium]|nr:beta-ketoacyl synthase chain length factor [Xanthomonadales bacterium]